MNGRAGGTPLCLLVTIGLLAMAGWYAITPRERAIAWLQVLVAQQLADTFGREVQLGRIEGNLVTGVVAHKVAVAEGERLAEGAILEAERIELHYDLVRVLRGEIAPAASVDRVGLDGAYARVLRDEQGQVNLLKILPKGPPAAPEARFRGKVEVADSEICYEDQTVRSVDGRPLTLEFSGVEGEVSLKRAGWVEASVSGWERLGRMGHLSGSVEMREGTGFVWAEAEVSGLNLPWWYDFVAANPELDLGEGTAQVSGTVAMVPREGVASEFLVACECAVRDGRARVKALNEAAIDFEGEASVSLDGAEVHRLEARVGGTRVRAEGFVTDLTDPVLDLCFQGEAMRPAELTELVPQLAESLAQVRLDSPVQVAGQILGSPAHGDLSVTASLPGAVSYASEKLGAAQAAGLKVTAQVLDLSEPTVRAEAQAVQVRLTDLSGLEEAMGEQLPGPLEVAPMQDVKVALLWSGAQPVIQTDVEIPLISAGDVTVQDVAARAAMVGMVVSLDNLRARPLGSVLSGQAVVDLRDAEQPWAYFSGDVAGLDVARLRELPAAEKLGELSGTLDGRVVAFYEGGEVGVLAEAVISEPSYQEHGVESVQALVAVDRDGLEVQRGRIADGTEDIWVRGVVPWEGEMALRFGGGEVDLARLLGRFDITGVRGKAYVSGAATGTAQAPEFEVSVHGFDVGWRDYEVDALVARAHGNLETAHLDSLYASSGLLVASAEGSVTEIDRESKDGKLDGWVRVAGPIDEHTRTMAGIEGLDLEGTARLEANLGGTLKQPIADGQLFAKYARYETLASDAALMQVRLEGDTLNLDNMRVQVGDAVVSGSATIASLRQDPVLAAKLSARNVVLQDLAWWQEVGLPLSGRVDLPYCDLQGPLDDLQGLAQLEAQDLVLGEEQIGSLSAWMVLDNELLMLRRTSVDFAGGSLALQGQYALLDREILPSTVELEGIAVPRLLSAARPIAATFVEPREGKRPLHQQLASLALRLGGKLDGQVSLQGKLPEKPTEEAEAHGPGETEAQEPQDLLAGLSGAINLTVAEASVDRRGLPDIAAQAQIAGRSLTGVNVEATEGDALITASGDWDLEGDVNVLAEVYALDLARLRERGWLPEVVGSVGGQLNLTVQASGAHDAPNLVGSVDVIDAEVHGARFDLVSAPIIRIDGERIAVDSLELRRGEEQIFVDGEVPFEWGAGGVPADSPLSITARTENANLGFFPPMLAALVGGEDQQEGLLSRLQAEGSVDSQVEITGTVARPQLQGTVSLADGQVTAPGWKQAIEDLGMEARFSRLGGETLFELKKLHARADATTLEAGGRAQLGTFDPARLHQNEYDFSARIAAEEQSFGGDVRMADLGGEIQLHTVDRGRQLLTVDDLGGEVGGGRVSLDGSVSLESFLPSRIAENQFNLALRVDQARPRYSHLFSGNVDGEITVTTPAPDQPVRIAGALEVSNATVGVPGPTGEPAGEMKGMPEDFPSPSFDVAVLIGPKVQVQGGGMVAPLQPTDRALRLSGTPQEPLLRGRIDLQEGEASVPGGVLQIESGGIDYMLRKALGSRKPPVTLELHGRVWASAHRKIPKAVVNGREVGPVQIRLEVGGTLPANIFIQATSDPPMAEEEIYALLGTQPLLLAGLGAEESLTDVMSKQFLSALGTAFRHYVFQPFEEELREMLGLAMLEVSFAFDQPLEVKVGRYLVKDLLVTYERSLSGDQEAFDLAISYKVRDQVEVSYQTDESDEDRLLVEYVRSF